MTATLLRPGIGERDCHSTSEVPEYSLSAVRPRRIGGSDGRVSVQARDGRRCAGRADAVAPSCGGLCRSRRLRSPTSGRSTSARPF
jgi:hypothetical protein